MTPGRSPTGRPSESGTDWSQPSLLPAHLKRKPPIVKELPPIDEVEEQDAVPEKVETAAVHMTTEQRYIQITEAT